MRQDRKPDKIFRMIIMSVVCVGVVLLMEYLTIDTLHDATVDPLTGDVACVYSNVYGDFVNVYDRDGNFLFGKRLDLIGGKSYICYQEGLLQVYILRADEVRVYDRQGTLVQTYTTEISRFMKQGFFEDWEKDGSLYTCTQGDYLYCYRESFWRREAVLWIENQQTGTHTVLYDASKTS